MDVTVVQRTRRTVSKAALITHFSFSSSDTDPPDALYECVGNIIEEENLPQVLFCRIGDNGITAL
jgi:hypothetical protein